MKPFVFTQKMIQGRTFALKKQWQLVEAPCCKLKDISWNLIGQKRNDKPDANKSKRHYFLKANEL